MENYEVFQAVLESIDDQIRRGEDVKIPLKDLKTMSKIYVRAKISDKLNDLKDAESLRVVNDMGERVGSKYITIIEELSDEEVSALPHQ